MACAGCSVNLKDGQPIGCRNNGNCSTGGCNRLNTYDWISTLELEDIEPFNIVEVSFKNGSRKAFYYNQPFTRASTGDLVVVDTQAGYDVGRISLSGELVRLQMRKKRVPEDGYFPKVIRKANERDLEKLEEVRSQETPSMIRARAISRTLGLNMKIGDVEFQGDDKKATFYYTADGRVDFRELIRHFAKEFKVKIEMRQIGARQESARIGGIGPCGRELCCSTWLTTYRTVSTAAARYQNLAINQAKLSGQCGRLKCCLNYELDTYMEALSNFPEDAEKLRTRSGVAIMMKTDIFKGLMYYGYEHEHGRGRLYALDLQQVRSVREMNRRGEMPEDLALLQVVQETVHTDEDHGYGPDDLTGVIELPPDEKRRRKKKKKGKERDSREAGGGRQERKPAQPGQQRSAAKAQEARKPADNAPDARRQETPGQEKTRQQKAPDARRQETPGQEKTRQQKAPDARRQETPGQEKNRSEKAPDARRQESPGQETPRPEGREGAAKKRGRGGRNRRGRGRDGDKGKEE